MLFFFWVTLYFLADNNNSKDPSNTSERPTPTVGCTEVRAKAVPVSQWILRDSAAGGWLLAVKKERWQVTSEDAEEIRGRAWPKLWLFFNIPPYFSAPAPSDTSFPLLFRQMHPFPQRPWKRQLVSVGICLEVGCNFSQAEPPPPQGNSRF
jgi:hypothetical protein